MLQNLEASLTRVEYRAIDESRVAGIASLPLLRRYSRDRDHRIRKLTMHCAGVIDLARSGLILVEGLDDENLNVKSAAANELAQRTCPAAADAIGDRLVAEEDELMLEQLALAAGRSPGARSLELLSSVKPGGAVLAAHISMALARLGDAEARRILLDELEAPQARSRYDALEKLIYVAERGYAPRAMRLLGDRAEAVRVGFVQMPRYRRVCDQAVDTLAQLLGVRTDFPLAEDKLYSPAEIASMQILSSQKHPAAE
jgi:HEAT repeat protein